MPRYLSYLFGSIIAALVIGGPVGYSYYQQSQLRNFRVVRERTLYRSGQMHLTALKRVVHEFGIKTVVTLRDAYCLGNPPPDLEEEAYCKGQEINYYRITPREWGSQNGTVPAEEGVRQFLDIMQDPSNYPVLVHCFAGIHRTGAFCAIYRMEFEHWSNDAAINEMRLCGYNNLDDEFDVLGFLEQYRPTWLGPGEPAKPAVPSISDPAKIKRKRRPKHY